MTQRTRAQLLTLLDTNGVGGIDGEDLNDFVETVMEDEFVNPGDFWAQPKPRNISTENTVRGWRDYSQIMLSACSFGAVLVLTASGTWRPADAADSGLNPGVGVACDSYAAAESQAQILRDGIVYISALSGLFSGYIGRPLYLNSGTVGSVAVTKPTYAQVIGFIEPADIGSTGTLGKWRFKPAWDVVGA